MHALFGFVALIGSLVLFVVHAIHQFQKHLPGWQDTWTALRLAGPITDLIIPIWALETRMLESLFWTYLSWEYLVILALFIFGWNTCVHRSPEHNDPIEF